MSDDVAAPHGGPVLVHGGEQVHGSDHVHGREHPPARERGATVWLTGLPSSGKTTIACAVAAELRAAGHRVEILDGDEFRTRLSRGLGYSREDRTTHVYRVGWVAQLLARNGVKVLAPVIAPHADARAVIREQHLGTGTCYCEVHVATPLDVCVARDVKGLYAKQRSGEITGLTGVDDPYEVPVDPELRLHTHQETVETSAGRVLAVLRARGLV